MESNGEVGGKGVDFGVGRSVDGGGDDTTPGASSGRTEKGEGTPAVVAARATIEPSSDVGGGGSDSDGVTSDGGGGGGWRADAKPAGEYPGGVPSAPAPARRATAKPPRGVKPNPPPPPPPPPL